MAGPGRIENTDATIGRQGQHMTYKINRDEKGNIQTIDVEWNSHTYHKIRSEDVQAFKALEQEAITDLKNLLTGIVAELDEKNSAIDAVLKHLRRAEDWRSGWAQIAVMQAGAIAAAHKLLKTGDADGAIDCLEQVVARTLEWATDLLAVE